MTAYIDVLDLWAVPAVLRTVPRGDSIVYLMPGRPWMFSLGVRLLALSGRKTRAVTSAFLADDSRAAYRAHVEATRRLALDMMEPDRRRRYSKLGFTNDDECRRTSLFVTVREPRATALAAELLLSILADSPNDGAVALLRNGEYVRFADALYREHGFAAKAYKTNFRLPRRPRDGFVNHPRPEGPNLMQRLFGLARAFIGETRHLLSAVAPLLRKRTVSSADALLLVCRPNPIPGFNDNYWAESLRKDHGLKVAALITVPLNEQATRYYREKSDSLLAMEDMNRRFGAAEGRLLIKRSLTLLGLTMRGLFRGAIKIAEVPTILALHRNAAIFEAMMRATGARISFAALAGHSLEAAALTLASGRVGGVNFGCHWSMGELPDLGCAFADNHVQFVWGRRQKRIYDASKALYWYCVATGYQTAGRYLWDGWDEGRKPDWLVELLEKKGQTRAITLYDNKGAHDLYITQNEMSAMLEALLDFVDAAQDVLLIVKAKGQTLESVGSDLAARITKAQHAGSVHVIDEFGALMPGLAADLTIGISPSSLAFVSAGLGAPTIIYDRCGMFEGPNSYPPGLDNLTVIDELAKLAPGIARALGETYRRRPARSDLMAFPDGLGEYRMADFMAKVSASLHAGQSPREALATAADAYEQEWGADSCWACPALASQDQIDPNNRDSIEQASTCAAQ
ncbi:MAG: hypothetical protein CMM61_03115 [Rhodospirillaceae bacterium]|nr:hypothetical protein [Rhodospirillaceae bacterium]